VAQDLEKTQKRVLIIGHGSIGSVFACSFFERGYVVDALSLASEFGLRSRQIMQEDGDPRSYDFESVGPESLGKRNYRYVILSVKTTAIAVVAEYLVHAIKDNTTVVSAMNGVPWWFSEEVSNSVPFSKIQPANIVGCVINLAATRNGQTEIALRKNSELLFGAASLDTDGQGATVVAELLDSEWLRCRKVANIRKSLWQKLLNNASVNPVSALCMANCGEVTANPQTRMLIKQIMMEVVTVGMACGVDVEVDIEERINWSASFGSFKTSMLQDLEGGRPLEVEALLSSIIRLGEAHGTPTPYLSSVAALIELRSRLNSGARS
jgi:2-dehydropantoate 2-reductase